MPATVYVVQPSDFVRAKADGHADLASAERLLSDIAEKAHGLQEFNVLIDVRTVSGALLSGDELWRLAEKFARHAHVAPRKTAILCSPDRFDNARFFALATGVRAQTSGAQVQPFMSYEEAMDWLLGNSPID